MRKKVLLSIILVFVLVFASFAYATEDYAIPEEWRRTAESTEKQLNTISDSHAMFDENANLQDSVVNGNIFGFGTNISLNNVTVYGDIFIAGQNITFSNITVYGTAFLAGEVINMNDVNFTGNIFNASQTMNFTGVAQDIFAAGESIAINEGSMISRDIFASANKIVFSGNVGKNAHVSATELIVDANSTVSGILNYSSENEANISADANIGNINFQEKEQVELEEEKSTITSAVLFSARAYNVVVLLVKAIFVCGFILLFAKGFIEKQKVSNVAGYIGKSTLKGILWAIIIPVISILLLFTGVSIGLSIVVIALYCIIFWISVPVVAISITANIKTKREYNSWRFFGLTIIIALLIAVLKQLPTIGGLVTIIVSLAGMGIIMTSLKRKKVNENIEVENVTSE